MNIEKVRKNNLCIQCGICNAVCPLKCISIKKIKNDYLPFIDKRKCVKCGICYQICSFSELKEYDFSKDIEDFILGNYLSIYKAQSKDNLILNNSTSGGVATTLIKTLLSNKEYDCAFVVDGYEYETQLKTKKIDINSDLLNSQKSRYLTVSHCDAVKYIKENPKQRVIIIGTGCIITSFLKVINFLNLNKDNYLFIGLFCDKTMNYGVCEYFKQHKVSKGKKLKKLFFRSKEISGWPGNVKLEYSDGACEFLDRTERMRIKDYFVPEKCLYCLNKLNRNADIALGDNYIDSNEDKKGISSVIIRTDLGKRIWEMCKDKFIFDVDKVDSFIKSQHLETKRINVAFASIKGLLNGKFTKNDKKLYTKALKKIKIGQKKNVYNAINGRNLIKSLFHNIFSIDRENVSGKDIKVITILWIKIKLS